mmetsp:Transcript_40940/g.92316  ORF Transcript_40940/g.92316 Transcript_40940/m.92316 type:complete len:146 (-) Transcript_40940:291-728(-)
MVECCTSGGGWVRLLCLIVCSQLGMLIVTVVSADCQGPGLAKASREVWYGVAAFVLVAALWDAGVGCSSEDGWKRSNFKTVFFTGLISWAPTQVSWLWGGSSPFIWAAAARLISLGSGVCCSPVCGVSGWEVGSGLCQGRFGGKF